MFNDTPSLFIQLEYYLLSLVGDVNLALLWNGNLSAFQIKIVFYTGKYTPGMPASKLVQYPQSPIVGGDRDEHGCIGSAGYVWCEVQKDCIRLFDKGIRTESVDDSNASAFIVFSPDSTQLELFFSNNQPNEILDRRGLPSGSYAWNVEDDDTKNVRLIDGLWTISQRNKLIYSQKAGN